MAETAVFQGNTISDLVVNGTGNFVNWPLVLNANGFDTWTPVLYAGQLITIPDDSDFNTQNLEALTLYPANNASAGDIDVQIDYVFALLSNAGSATAPVIIPEVQDTNTYYFVRPGETISDAVLNSTGNYENWSLILQANNSDTWTPDLYSSQRVIIPSNIVQLSNNYRALNQYPANNFSAADIDNQINAIFEEMIAPIDLWILATGFWNDNGIWVDEAEWID